MAVPIFKLHFETSFRKFHFATSLPRMQARSSIMIYRAIVRRRIRSIFDDANRGNVGAMIDALSSRFVYRFVGDTPLGGQRSSKAAMKAWWERLYRMFPGAKFHLQTIVVEGMPWATTVMTYVKINGTVPADAGIGRVPYENEFMQLMQLKWGKVTSVTTLEDTLRFANVLPRLAKAGIADATAVQITG
jgi:ketosteroid isomerase-like protein